MSDAERMPFTEHLKELRKRLMICAIAVLVGFLISYAFKEMLFDLLAQPWKQAVPAGQDTKLIYTAPHELFFTYLKVSFIAGVGVAMPVILSQVWLFIAPGLYANEKKYLIPVVFFSAFFFIGGALFGYFFVFPVGFQFFTSFATENIAPMVTTSEFLRFTTRILLAFGFVFELPVFTFFLAKLGLVSGHFLRRKRKIAIVIIFIVAAMLTPGPDIFSQLLMAGPLLILYELSIWIAIIFGRKPLVPEEDEAEESTKPVASTSPSAVEEDEEEELTDEQLIELRKQARYGKTHSDPRDEE